MNISTSKAYKAGVLYGTIVVRSDWRYLTLVIALIVEDWSAPRYYMESWKRWMICTSIYCTNCEALSLLDVKGMDHTRDVHICMHVTAEHSFFPGGLCHAKHLDAWDTEESRMMRLTGVTEIQSYLNRMYLTWEAHIMFQMHWVHTLMSGHGSARMHSMSYDLDSTPINWVVFHHMGRARRRPHCIRCRDKVLAGWSEE
jgi:hypothetical protein